VKSERLDLFRERSFTLLFGAHTVSLFGDAVAPIALAFAVLDLTSSPTDLGFAVAARTVPMILFVLAGGVWADRLPQQRLMIGSDVVRLVSQGLLAALLLTGNAVMWQIVLLQALNGGASAFFRPASSALLPRAVRPGRLQQANALLHLATSLTWVVGPVIAGGLVAGVGAGWAIAFDAATYGVSALLLLGLRLGGSLPQARTSFFRELWSGWTEVRTRSWVWVSLGAFAAFNVVWGPFWVLGPVVAREALGGASAWALVIAALGLGSLAGSVISFRFVPRRPLLAAHAAVVAAAPTFLLLGLRAPAVAVAAFAVPMGVALAFGNTLWETTLQRFVPQRSLSRVCAYDGLASMAFNPLGAAVAGPVAAVAGTRTTLFAAAALVVVAGGVFLLVTLTRAPQPDAVAQDAGELAQDEARGVAFDLVADRPLDRQHLLRHGSNRGVIEIRHLRVERPVLEHRAAEGHDVDCIDVLHCWPVHPREFARGFRIACFTRIGSESGWCFIVPIEP
jgi:predicted MFS family arabinose efflux permease